MAGWMELFEAGNYPQGDVSIEDLDEIVKNYDPAFHEAPAIIGHNTPDGKEEKPAHGWIEGVKRVGKKLLGKFKQIDPDLKEAVNSGRYKKRSIEVYKNLKDNEGKDKGKYLKAVAFLGASSPAVKGLADFQFTDSKGSYTRFNNNEEIQGEEDLYLEKERTKFQEQLATLKQKLKEEQEKAEKFQEILKAKDQEILKFREEKVKAEFSRWAEGCKSLPPKYVNDVIEFMMNLEGDNIMKFSDGQKTNLDWFKSFVESFPDVVNEGEQYTKEKAETVPETKYYSDDVDADRAEFNEKIIKYAQTHNISYEEAMMKLA